MAGITVRYAATDADVVYIHQFLCIVAGPTLPGDIDPKDSITEIWRVVTDDIALMAMRGDVMVGTIGLAVPGFWWNGKVKYLANRWFYTLPGVKAAKPLLKEAISIAKASGLELQMFYENKERFKLFNKSERRHGLRRRQGTEKGNEHAGPGADGCGNAKP